MEERFSPYGGDLFGNPVQAPAKGKLEADFIVPPFTVLNARDGYWQDRKRQWISMGIESEIGREGELTFTNNIATFRNRIDNTPDRKDLATTSIFDPVLCELAYTWFCPHGGQVVDPFAGGSVRGIVASCLGREYWGCDLREEQIDANVTQARALLTDTPWPQWVCGDSQDKLIDAPAADFIFSCPPYGDLERYSDDPRDISTLDYHTFIAVYSRIILKCCLGLKRDRFACFVVGEFRDKTTGTYRNFVGDTITAFMKCGLSLYNEAILVTQAGSLPFRAAKPFLVSRKLGKSHQNVLVFVKGNGKEAAKACGPLAEGYGLL